MWTIGITRVKPNGKVKKKIGGLKGRRVQVKVKVRFCLDEVSFRAVVAPLKTVVRKTY